MAIEQAYFETVLQEALTERDTQLQEKQLPEINIGEAIPITEGLDFAQEYIEYGITEVLGSVKDGIIGNKTNSLVTIDSTIDFKKAPVCKWAKAVVWTQQELEKINKLNKAKKQFEELNKLKVEVGVLENTRLYKDSDISVVEVATIHEFGTEKIQPRSFLRVPIRDHQKAIIEKAVKEKYRLFISGEVKRKGVSGLYR